MYEIRGSISRFDFIIFVFGTIFALAGVSELNGISRFLKREIPKCVSSSAVFFVQQVLLFEGYIERIILTSEEDELKRDILISTLLSSKKKKTRSCGAARILQSFHMPESYSFLF